MEVISLNQVAGQCQWCNKPATKLCDFVIGKGQAGRTCDRPLCEDHATNLGNVFYASHEAGHEIDTTDYCPVHAHMAAKWKF